MILRVGRDVLLCGRIPNLKLLPVPFGVEFRPLPELKSFLAGNDRHIRGEGDPKQLRLRPEGPMEQFRIRPGCFEVIKRPRGSVLIPLSDLHPAHDGNFLRNRKVFHPSVHTNISLTFDGSMLSNIFDTSVFRSTFSCRIRLTIRGSMLSLALCMDRYPDALAITSGPGS